MRTLIRVVVASLFLPVSLAFAEPAQKEFEPSGGKGPALVLVSGQTGPGNYNDLAKDLSGAGFHVVLVDGNDFWIKGGAGETLLKDVITRAQQSSHSSGGKVSVIGASLGGGPTLAYAARMPDLVSAVVAHYPLTSYITDPAGFVAKIRVPTLVLAGTFDTYKNCCLIETARKLGEASKAAPKPGLLQVYEYPGIDHGFSTDNAKRSDIKSDATKRTVEFLRQNAGTT